VVVVVVALLNRLTNRISSQGALSRKLPAYSGTLPSQGAAR